MSFVRILSLMTVVGYCCGTNTMAGDVLFEDTFNRPDSNYLGIPWKQGNEVTPPIAEKYGVRPAYIKLAEGKLMFDYAGSEYPGNYFSGAYAYAPLNCPALAFPIHISFTYSPDADERVLHMIGLMDLHAGHYIVQENFPEDTPQPGPEPKAGYFEPRRGLEVLVGRSGSGFDNSGVLFRSYVDLNKVESVYSYLPFQFDYGKKYHFELTINADYSMSVIVSGPDGSVTVASPPTTFSGLLDGVYVGDYQGSPENQGFTGNQLLGFDNLRVEQAGPQLCIRIPLVEP